MIFWRPVGTPRRLWTPRSRQNLTPCELSLGAMELCMLDYLKKRLVLFGIPFGTGLTAGTRAGGLHANASAA